jgi:hypothetical protein
MTFAEFLCVMALCGNALPPAEVDGVALGKTLEETRAVIAKINPSLVFFDLRSSDRVTGFTGRHMEGGLLADEFVVLTSWDNKVISVERNVRRFPLNRISHAELATKLLQGRNWLGQTIRPNQNTAWSTYRDGRPYVGPVDKSPCAPYAPTGDPAKLVPATPAVGAAPDCGLFMMVSLPGASTDGKVASYAVRAIDGKVMHDEGMTLPKAR